jgi:hypothetical protein
MVALCVLKGDEQDQKNDRDHVALDDNKLKQILEIRRAVRPVQFAVHN